MALETIIFQRQSAIIAACNQLVANSCTVVADIGKREPEEWPDDQLWVDERQRR